MDKLIPFHIETLHQARTDWLVGAIDDQAFQKACSEMAITWARKHIALLEALHKLGHQTGHMM